MPETYSARAIVLNRRPFRGYDTRIALYTLERGKIDLTVKGALRPASKLAAHLEPLTLADVMIVAGNTVFVGGAISRNCYPNLKADFDKLAAAGAAVGRLNRLLKEHIADEDIFRLTETFLIILDTRVAEPTWYQWLANIFLYKILERLGYGVNFAAYEPSSGQPKLKAEVKNFLAEAQKFDLEQAAGLKVSRSLLEDVNLFLEAWIREISEF